jgi:hypothetical protein
MKKLKYLRLFENFQSKIFKPEVLESLNSKLYGDINPTSGYGTTDISLIIEHWREEFLKIIKSVDAFENVEVQLIEEGPKDITIKVDWNDYCHPFEIGIISCGKITNGQEDERIGIRFDCSNDSRYPEIEDLETGNETDSETSIEFIFTLARNRVDNDYLSIEEWNDDAIPRLFRNIEKSVFTEN